jgi:hypothetical protein
MIQKKISTYNFPSENEFWSFISEYWLVKNAPELRFDFEHPDYGLLPAVKELFESLGLYEMTFKVLLLDSSTVYHFALPTNPNEFIFILSLPFIRAMDLSKLEIAVLLLEDFYRIRANYFKDYVYEKELDQYFGKISTRKI